MPTKLELLDADVRAQIAQLAEEGVEVGAFRQAYADCQGSDPAIKAEAYEALLAQMERLLTLSTADEPALLEDIRRLRPADRPQIALSLDHHRLYDRLLGGYLGRCAGCLLGKPFESRLIHKDDIARYLREADAYPLVDYAPVTPDLETRYRLHLSYKRATLGNISGMPRDDDIDYLVLNLLILEKYGFEFRPEDCAEQWLYRFPYHRIYSAGRAAYRNLINGIEPPATAYHHNPHRESLGGQIRADLWGYVAPGDPELAAQLAYRDSTLSQVRNGVYSGMFFAAVIASGFATPDLREAIEAGLAQIPPRSRLATAIRDLLVWTAEDGAWESTLQRIYARFGHQVFNYSIVNALISLLGPLYCEGDFGRAISVTVMGGFDTDCTGATAGSIMGVMHGARSIPSSWIAPLEDRYESHLAGIGQIRISELVLRTSRLVHWPTGRIEG